MRTTIIPAQITTVEDKIVGNLNFTQLILLLVPVLLSTVVYIALPVPMIISLYKIPLIIFNFLLFGTLAFRVKGKIVLEWIGIVSRFNLRPKYYIFDKNNTYLRSIYEPEDVVNIKKVSQPLLSKSNLNFAKLLTHEEKFLKSKVALTFKSKKGKVYVAVD